MTARSRFTCVDTEDPIAATLGRVFPGLLKPLSEMPEDLRTRLRYPQGIFALQAAMFATFHMTNPATFYNREDQWEIPSLEQGGEATPMAPYYTIMKLPGESGSGVHPDAALHAAAEGQPRGLDGRAQRRRATTGSSWCSSCPKQTVIFGPRQIAARINQDQVIAPQITLWNQQGSEVIQGTLLVIPIEESLAVHPAAVPACGRRPHSRAQARVVAYQNRIVMEETLDAALARLFPDERTRRDRCNASRRHAGPNRASRRASAADRRAGGTGAERTTERAMQAQRDGDWAQYGEEIKRLGEVLERINARR